MKRSRSERGTYNILVPQKAAIPTHLRDFARLLVAKWLDQSEKAIEDYYHIAAQVVLVKHGLRPAAFFNGSKVETEKLNSVAQTFFAPIHKAGTDYTYLDPIWGVVLITADHGLLFVGQRHLREMEKTLKIRKRGPVATGLFLGYPRGSVSRYCAELKSGRVDPVDRFLKQAGARAPLFGIKKSKHGNGRYAHRLLPFIPDRPSTGVRFLERSARLISHLPHLAAKYPELKEFGASDLTAK